MYIKFCFVEKKNHWLMSTFYINKYKLNLVNIFPIYFIFYKCNQNTIHYIDKQRINYLKTLYKNFWNSSNFSLYTYTNDLVNQKKTHFIFKTLPQIFISYYITYCVSIDILYIYFHWKNSFILKPINQSMLPHIIKIYLSRYIRKEKNTFLLKKKKKNEIKKIFMYL